MPTVALVKLTRSSRWRCTGTNEQVKALIFGSAFLIFAKKYFLMLEFLNILIYFNINRIISADSFRGHRRVICLYTMAMLCYVMLRYAMVCYVMLCYVACMYVCMCVCM